MPYVQIVLTDLPLTREQERELSARTVEMMAGLFGKTREGTMVSVQEVSGREEFLQGDRPKAIHFYVHTPSRTISAEQRAKLTWAAIEMSKRLLGNDPDTAYLVDIKDASAESEAHGVLGPSVAERKSAHARGR